MLLLLSCGKLDNLEAPQFAFRFGYQTHEVVFIFRNLIEKAIEWNIPLFVLDGDLAKAYDYTLHSSIIAALLEQMCPRSWQQVGLERSGEERRLLYWTGASQPNQ